MYLLWISGFDISPVWMCPWLNGLKSASSALHSMYYSPLFSKWSLYGLYIIHFLFCIWGKVRSIWIAFQQQLILICIIEVSFHNSRLHFYSMEVPIMMEPKHQQYALNPLLLWAARSLNHVCFILHLQILFLTELCVHFLYLPVGITL